MSVEALQYVKALCASAEVRALSVSERHVLRAIALMYDQRVGCSYAPVPKLAFEALLHERTVQRCLKTLAAKGMVRTHPAKRDKDGSQTTNEYELPGMQGMAVAGLSGRQQVFAASRSRVAVQMELVDDAVTGTAGGFENAQQVLTGAVDISLCPREMSPPPVTAVSPPPVTYVSPRDVVFEVASEVKYPPLPLLPVAEVEKNKQRQGLPGETKPQEQGHATARATATAWAGHEAEATTRSEAQGSRGVRPAARERAGLDGIDAALADEAVRVLVACGMVPDGVTRRLRAGVEGALRLRVERARCSVAAAGLLAETRWREYRAATPELQFRMGPRRFFVEGEWLDPAGWPRDRKEAARRSEARVGVLAG